MDFQRDLRVMVPKTRIASGTKKATSRGRGYRQQLLLLFGIRAAAKPPSVTTEWTASLIIAALPVRVATVNFVTAINPLPTNAE